MSPRETSLSAVVRDGEYAVPCAEIDALAEELVLRGAPFLCGPMEFEGGTCGWHVVYRCAGHEVSVIWSFASYGSKLGLLEAMPIGVDHADPTGWLCAADVLRMYPPEAES